MQPRTPNRLALTSTAIVLTVVALAPVTASTANAANAANRSSAPAAPIIQKIAAGTVMTGDPSNLANHNSRKCLDAIRGERPVVQRDCWNILRQRWDFRDAGGGTFNIVNVFTGECLAIGGSSTDPGAPAIQWPCLGIPDQAWVRRTVGSNINEFNLVNVNSGQCLAIGAGDTASGAAAIQWPCVGIPDQSWARYIDPPGMPIPPPPHR